MEILSYENYCSSQNFLIDKNVIEVLVAGDISEYNFYVDLEKNIVSEKESLWETVDEIELNEIRVLRNRNPEEKEKAFLKKRKKEIRAKEKNLKAKNRNFKMKQRLSKREARFAKKAEKSGMKRTGLKVAKKPKGPKTVKIGKVTRGRGGKKGLAIAAAATATLATIAALRKKKKKLQKEMINADLSQKKTLNQKLSTLNAKEAKLRDKIKESYNSYLSKNVEVEISESNFDYVLDLTHDFLDIFKEQ